MSTPASPIATADVGDFHVDSNTESSADISKGIAAVDKAEGKEAKEGEEPKSPKQKTSEAAAELGKRGGEASARAREERQKAAPEPEAKSEPKQAAETDEPDAESKPEKKERPLGNPRHDPRARMLQATHQAAELKRELAARDNEMAAMRSQLQELQNLAARATGQRPDPRTLTQPPDFSDYDTVEEFARASSQYEVAQYERQRRQHEQIRVQAHQEADRVIREVESFQDKIVAANLHTAEGVETIDPAITSLTPSNMLPAGVESDSFNWIADELLKAEDPAGTMVYLTGHMDEFERLLSYPKKALSYVMRRIEARAAAERGESDNGNGNDGASRRMTPVPASSARPPVRPVRTSAEDVSVDDSELSLDQYLDKNLSRPRARR